MPPKQRAADAGTIRGRAILADLRREARIARRDRGLSLEAVGRAVGMSQAAMTRFEQGGTDDIGILRVSRIFAVVGLQLSARAYPGDGPLRDAAHARLLGSFRAGLHPTLRWQTEAPLPQPGYQRAWDALVSGPGWRYGIEAETHPTDAQALIRRLELKLRDGAVDGVILVLPATGHVRLFLASTAGLLEPPFPMPGPRALELLANGSDPGGSSVIVPRVSLVGDHDPARH